MIVAISGVPNHLLKLIKSNLEKQRLKVRKILLFGLGGNSHNLRDKFKFHAQNIINQLHNHIQQEPDLLSESFGLIAFLPKRLLSDFIREFEYSCLFARIDPTETLKRIGRIESDDDVFLNRITSEHTNRTIANEIYREIARRIDWLNSSSRAINNYILADGNRSPLLLPVKNFNSQTLTQSLDHLTQELSDGIHLKDEKLIELVSKLKEPTKAQQIELSGRRVRAFIGNGIIFAFPGRDLHGYLHREARIPPHRPLCTLKNNWRLGIPIYRGFHYDCTSSKPGSKIDRELLNCHSGNENPDQIHINIYPSDYLRK